MEPEPREQPPAERSILWRHPDVISRKPWAAASADEAAEYRRQSRASVERVGMVMRRAGEHDDLVSALHKLVRESSHNVGSRDVVGRKDETED